MTVLPCGAIVPGLIVLGAILPGAILPGVVVLVHVRNPVTVGVALLLLGHPPVHPVADAQDHGGQSGREQRPGQHPDLDEVVARAARAAGASAAGGSVRVHVIRATASGSFTTTFTAVTLERCAPYFVTARGARGSVAVLRSSPFRQCAPLRAPS